MFKSLLRTLPTLSGNYTISCKLNEYSKLDSNNYEVYVREASLMPLQNDLYIKNIELNLNKDQHEYVITSFYNAYSNVFYNTNYNYDKNNYREYDQYEINRNNDSRNKDYEFGCKRLYYAHTNYQFMFYAPFYIDDVEDLPEYFIINIEFSSKLVKTIKIYINKDNYRNYLKTYLKKYVKHIDNKVIFCLPESKQATYFGIDVKNGGLVKYTDNVIGNIYTTQNTINNFDYIICSGFKRNNLVMRQIIPLSFMFNINDLFDDNERKFFNSCNIKISGFYYNKFNFKENFYDFSIDYYNFYHKYLKYDSNIGKYYLDYTYLDDGEKLNIMNISYPSLNEGRFTKYRFTNKITPSYCRFKLLFSEDENPYITNMSFGYSYIQYPNNKYGYFPTMFKDIYPNAVINNESIMLPIGTNIHKYYLSDNIEKYNKLMSNHYSSWYNILYDDENIFNIKTYWSNIYDKYSYFNGVLYNFKNDIDDNQNKFGIFLKLSMNIVDNETAINDIISVKYILSKTNSLSNYKNTIKMKNISYNDSYIKENILDNYNIITNINFDEDDNANSYGLDIDLNIFNDENVDNKHFKILENLTTEQQNGEYIQLSLNNNVKSYFNNIYFENINVSDYLTYDIKLIKDINGTYVLENNYYSKNKYYKVKDIIDLLNTINDSLNYHEVSNIILSLISNINKVKIIGYEYLPIYNNINIYVEETKHNNKYYRLVFDNDIFNDIKNNIYIEAQFLNDRTLLDNVSEVLNDNVDKYNSIKIYTKNEYISEQDLFNICVSNKYAISNLYWTSSDFNEAYLKELLNNQNIYEIKNRIYVYENSFRYGLTENDILNAINKCNNELLNVDNYDIYELINSEYFNYQWMHNRELQGYINEENDNLYIYNFINIYLSLFTDLTTEDIDTEIIELVKQLCNYHINLVKLYKSTLNNLKNNELYSYFTNSLGTNEYNTFGLGFIYYIYNKLINLSSYNFCPYSFEKNIGSYNYFIQNIETYDNYIYVDPYNLNEYIYKYNKLKHKTDKNFVDIPYIKENSVYKLKNFYCKLLNLEHIKVYSRELHAYMNKCLNPKKLKDYSINIIDHIYVKSRNYIIENNNISIKDNYVVLSEYLKKYRSTHSYVNYLFKLSKEWITTIDTTIKYDFKAYKNCNDLFFKVMCSEYRNNNNKFVIKLDETTSIEVDLVLNKYFVQMNEYLYEILKEGSTYLYLYKCDPCKENNDMWSYSNINGDIKEVNDFLVPLFKNVYINESDTLNIQNLINHNKIKNYKYIEHNEIYAKQINVDNYVATYIHDNDKLNELHNVLDKLNIDYDENDYIYNKVILLKEADNDYYRNIFIKDILGIILYDIYDNNILNMNTNIKELFSDDLIQKYNITYNEDTNLYHAKDKYNNEYIFYVLNFLFDNTNNSFNINNSYDVSSSFNQINNNVLSNNIINDNFKLLNPFLKTNIFRTFVNKKYNNIIKPNELDIFINYIASQIRTNEEYKYINLKDNNNDIIYDNIIKNSKNKKIKLIRYFNYITPILEEKTTLNNVWENLFITNDNYSTKHNILCKNNINIYEYHPIHLCTSYDYVNNKEISYENIYQYEYKHFNDNHFYNLKEEFIISLDDEIKYDDLINIYETEEKTINIFTNYINKTLKKKLDLNIILFLYNKYNVNYLTESYKLNTVKNTKLYKISYKFNLK